MMTFKDLCDEIKRRATKDQGGATFDTAIKNAANSSLFRISRDALWRQMRRKTTFNTIASYSTGNASVTSSSANITIADAKLVTNNIQINRKMKLSGSATYFDISAITGETTLTLDREFNGSTSTANSWEILPQEEYNLPVQAGHRMFMWHEDYGYPLKMNYIPEQEFLERSIYVTDTGTPTHYRMWGENMVIEQLATASTLCAHSTSASDTTVNLMIFGIVSGYPDYDTISINGSTLVGTTKTFTSVERVVKGSSSVGRITVYANSNTSTTVSVMPVGDTTGGILYKKVKLYPLPTRVFPIYVQYYKDPYRLVNDNDIHELGQEFDEVIILLATAKIKAESNQAEADRFMLLFIDELKSLKRVNTDKIDWFPTLKRPNEMGGDIFAHKFLQFRQAGSNFGPRI